MRAIQFLVIFSLIFNSPFAVAQDTSQGGQPRRNTNSQQPRSSTTSQVPTDARVKEGTCPTALKESVLADAGTSSVNFAYNGDNEQCRRSVSAYQNLINGKGQQSQFQTADAYNQQLRKQFSSVISADLDKSIAACNTSSELSPEQAKVVQSRFYAAATRIENFNKTAMDEMAYIDSLTPGSGVLDGVECTSLLPDLKKKCEEYRSIGGACRSDASKRLDAQVDKTETALAKIESLKKAEDKCKQAVRTQKAPGTTKCSNITKAIEVIKDEVPWVRGEVFDKLARNSKARSSTSGAYLGRDKIKEALTEQLKANRAALAGAYNSNLKNLRCLFNNTDNGEKCDFSKMSTDLAKLDKPQVSATVDHGSPNSELVTSMDAESCLLTRTKPALSGASGNASGLVSLTRANAVADGASVLSSLSKTAISERRGVFANPVGQREYTNLLDSPTRNSYNTCASEPNKVLNAGVDNRAKKTNLVCEKVTSEYSQATAVKNSCLIGSLLSGNDLLPFLDGAAPRAVVNTSPRSATSATPVAQAAAPAAAAIVAAGPVVDPASTVVVQPSATDKTLASPVVTQVQVPVVSGANPRLTTQENKDINFYTRTAAPASATDALSRQEQYVQTARDRHQRTMGTGGHNLAPAHTTAGPAPGADGNTTQQAAYKLGTITTNSGNQNNSSLASTNTTLNTAQANNQTSTGYSLGNSFNNSSVGVTREQLERVLNMAQSQTAVKPSGGSTGGGVTSLAVKPPTTGDTRGNATNTSGLAAAAPSVPSAGGQKTLSQAVADRTQTVSLQSDNTARSGGGGSSAGGASSGGGSRVPASVHNQAHNNGAASAAENDLINIMSGAGKSSGSASVQNGSGGGNAKANFGSGRTSKRDDEGSIEVIDKTTNARFTVGELIRIPKFEKDKDADFTVVKKLENGLLRVKDEKEKEFDLLRDEVKRAIRLSLNGAPDPFLVAKPEMTPAKIGQNLPPGELINAPIVDSVKLKNEAVRSGDKVTVSGFSGGGALQANIVYKNPDGTMRVIDEGGKEFDLTPADMKNAKFSRDLPEDVRKNLEIPDDAGRIAAAQSYVGRPLTSIQEAAVIKSQKIASDVGLYSLSKADANAKAKVLRDAGFTDTEAKMLLEKGITAGAGIETVQLVADRAPAPKFDVVKGQQIQIPVGSGQTYPGAVMGGPDKQGLYDVEFYQKGIGISRVKKSAQELTAANVDVPAKVTNPLINVPIAGQEISYPGRVISGPNAQGKYQVEIYPSGKILSVSELTLKRANTPIAVRQAQLRSARLASYSRLSSAELEAVVSDSFYEAARLKQKKISVDGAKALDELARRQNRTTKELYEEMKTASKVQAQPKVAIRNTADVFNSVAASGARNEIGYLAQKDGLSGENFDQIDRDNVARELGIREVNHVAGIDYGVIASRTDTRKLFDRILPGNKTFDAELLRQTMSYSPDSGYIGSREFLNAEKFVEAFKNADVSQLTLAERRLLNRYTDRAPLYARQANPDVPLIPRQNDEISARRIASLDEVGFVAAAAGRSSVEDADKTASESSDRLDELAEQDGLRSTLLTERQRETIARELGIYDEKKTAALAYKAVASKKETKSLFAEIFPGQNSFDQNLLRQTLSYNPRSGFITDAEYVNAAKFVEAVTKTKIDGSTLTLSQRRLLNRFTERAPLYVRQVLPETPSIASQSLEAVVPPLITHNKVATFAARGDEIVAQANIKPELARAGDQIHLKNFEGKADLNAVYVRNNKNGTLRVKDLRGKEFNLEQQALADAKFYRGLTAELKVNGDLDSTSRQKAAEGYVRHSLTQNQKDAVLAAYQVGGKERGHFDYTSDELKQKTTLLRKGGFTVDEAGLLLRKGVVGNSPSALTQMIKVEPTEVQLGDQVFIQEFNGTGELRGEIIGPAKNGGVVVREENGTETVVYSTDLSDLSNARVTRNPNLRGIASEGGTYSLQKTPVNPSIAVRKSVPVPLADIRNGDRVFVSGFNGLGTLEGFIVGTTKNGGYLVRGSDGTEKTIYKSDLEDTQHATVVREWGTKIPALRSKSNEALDFSPDSPLLVAKDTKNNPDIVVPLGNGEYRQGRVVARVEPKPGLQKSYTVEYADEAGVVNYMNLTQEQLLAAATPEALKLVKEQHKRSSEYQAKNDTELRQILDEGHRGTKEALGKGRTVDKQDLNAETQSAIAELARRSGVTSRAVFEAYKRGGIQGVEAVASAQTTKSTNRAPASLGQPVTAGTDVGAELAKLKTSDFIVTAGIGDKVKLPKSEIEGHVLTHENVNGETVYNIGVKKSDKVMSFHKLTARELGEANPQFVSVKAARISNTDVEAVKAQIENDFKNVKNKNVHVNSGVVGLDGTPYVESKSDDRFMTLLKDVARVQGYKNVDKKFSFNEVKANTLKFTKEKQEAIAKAQAGKLGYANNDLRNHIEDTQSILDNRQGLINDSIALLDQIDGSLASMIAKDVGRSGNANFTTWELTLNEVSGKPGNVKVNFATSVNLARNEAMAQLRELSAQERKNLLSAQSRLDYDKVYFTELRTKMGVPKRPEPLSGESLFAEFDQTGLAKDLDSTIAVRARNFGLRDVNDITTAHPLTPVVEKQRQIMSRLSRIDKKIQPENYSKMSVRVANDFAKTGEIDLAIPYYRAAADTINENLGASAKSFWSNEANGKLAMKAGFISDNKEVAHLAIDKWIDVKIKASNQNAQKLALDQYYNLGYEYERIFQGVKRYGNKNKELDLWVLRKQQQYLSQKFNLKSDIESVSGKDSWQTMENQANLSVNDLFVRRVPASTKAP